VAVAREALDAWNRGDTDAWIDAYHPECVVHARLMSREPYVGHVGLRQWQQDMYDAFGRFQIEWDELHDAPAGMIALGHVKLEGKASQVAFAQPIGYVGTIENGKITLLRVFLDHDQARREGERPPGPTPGPPSG